jgi:isopentenyl-diphosphate delta-isomerase
MTIQKAGPNMDLNTVIRVNEHGDKIGIMEKLDAHKGNGFLHRAVSIFVFDSEQKLLMQKRAQDKYHSGGLWANTACSHVYDGEDTKGAARRCLSNEMGITNVFLSEIFSFVYKESVGNNLTEYEFDHVFVGLSDENPVANCSEVKDYKKGNLLEISNEIAMNPNAFAPWFKIILRDHITKLYSGLKKFQRK